MKLSHDLSVSLGQCFWIGLNGRNIHDPETQRILSIFQPGGFILFKRNIGNIAQTSRFLSQLKKSCTIPPFLAVDQEGGTVERLNEIIGTIPPSMALTASASLPLAQKLHASHARILAALGFNVNFNPVLDLAVGSPGNGLGTRCFSDDPKIITQYATALLRAYEQQNILGCGKHFPGLGDTKLDSHLELPVVPRSWNQILRQDLLPYKNLLANLPFIMVNHALYPEMNSQFPASLAPEIPQILDNWNYKGLVISDDLMMGAVSNAWSLAGAAELALRAGNHLFLICSPMGIADAFYELLKRAQSDHEFATMIHRNAAHILNFKLKRLKQRGAVASISKQKLEMERLSALISKRAITQLKGSELPLSERNWSLFLPKTKWIQKSGTPLAQWLRGKKMRVKEYLYPIELNVDEARQLADQSSTEWNVVMVTGISNRPGQRELLRVLSSAGKRVGVIHGSYPRDIIPDEAENLIACYWTSPAAQTAAVAALFDAKKRTGIWPFKTDIGPGDQKRVKNRTNKARGFTK